MSKATALIALSLAWCYDDIGIFYTATCILIGSAAVVSITARGL